MSRSNSWLNGSRENHSTKNCQMTPWKVIAMMYLWWTDRTSEILRSGKMTRKKKYTESNSRKLHWVSHKKIIQWFFLEPPCKFVFLGYVVLLNYYLTFHKWKLTGTIFVSSQILQQKKTNNCFIGSSSQLILCVLFYNFVGIHFWILHLATLFYHITACCWHATVDSS